tara:strand:+ start:9325 stop:12648 length:3324 start_codon:yes stop_codon:yes gene_type:complete
MKTTIFTIVLILFQGIYFSQNNYSLNSTESYIPGDLIVKLTDEGNIRNIVSRINAKFQLKIFKELSPTANIWQLKFDYHQITHDEILKWLYKQPHVDLAQNNYYLDLRSTFPNDASFTEQWHHHNTGQTGGTEDADIDSDLAWDITTGGTTASGHDIVIALIESGNLDHQDLNANRWYNINEIEGNGIDDDGNGYVDDYNGWNPVQGNDNYGTGAHGTNCLGMMGAKGNNGLNVTGANWDVKLMVIGGYNINTDANAIAAYQYPLDMRTLWNNSGGSQGAFVVATSSSWGIDGENPSNHPVWCSFYTTLGEAGILNVGATTNQNLNVDTAGDMPTACESPYMVGVGRTDHNDNTAGGYGASTINFGAPGIDVVTTAGTSGITTTTGTSFSCPLTAGVIGLAYSIPCSNFMDLVIESPQAGADLVLEALMEGTDYKSQLANKFITGGRLNSRNTLDVLMGNVCDGDICLSPSSITVNDISTNSANIQFNAASSAISTLFYWREIGNPDWTIDSMATSPLTLNDLSECSDYEFYLESFCENNTNNQTSVQIFSTFGCGNCVDLAYCSSSASDGIDEWIETIEIGDYSFNSGNDQGYGNFTSSLGSIDLKEGQTYSVTIIPEWSGQLYNEQSRIWIDLNQDGNFADTELVFDQGESSQTTVTGTMTIPSGSSIGETRMRVQMAYDDGVSALPGVCEQFMWGEVEDYCINIEQEMICGMNVESVINQPQCSGVDNGSISVSVLEGNSHYNFEWSNELGADSVVSNLASGVFELTIVDSLMCDTTIIYNLNYLPSGFNVTSIVNEPQCQGLDNGTISIIVSGGNSLYEFEWENNLGNVTDLTGLSEGEYIVKITDSLMCDTTISYDLDFLSTLSISSIIENPSCYGSSDGSISVIAEGSLGYNYEWSTAFGNVPEIDSLLAGNYSVEITDLYGCLVSEEFVLTQPFQEQVEYDYSINNLRVDFENQSSFGNYSWNFGDSTSSSSANPFHIYDYSGTYTVCLNLTTVCSAISVCKDITVEGENPNTSVNEIKAKNSILVYPNPASSSLFFEINDPNVFSIKVLDLSGRIIEQRIINNLKEEFQLNNYSNGMYLYQILNEENKIIQISTFNILK